MAFPDSKSDGKSLKAIGEKPCRPQSVTFEAHPVFAFVAAAGGRAIAVELLGIYERTRALFIAEIGQLDAPSRRSRATTLTSRSTFSGHRAARSRADGISSTTKNRPSSAATQTASHFQITQPIESRSVFPAPTAPPETACKALTAGLIASATDDLALSETRLQPHPAQAPTPADQHPASPGRPSAVSGSDHNARCAIRPAPECPGRPVPA